MKSVRHLVLTVLALVACDGAPESSSADKSAVADGLDAGATGCDVCVAAETLNPTLGPCASGTLPTTGRLYDQAADCVSPETTVLACYPDISPDAYATQGSGCYVHEPTGVAFIAVWDGPELSGEYHRCDEKYWQIREAAAEAEPCVDGAPAQACGSPDRAGECGAGCTPVYGAPWNVGEGCAQGKVELGWCTYLYSDAPPHWCVVDEATGTVYLGVNGVPHGHRQCTEAELPAASAVQWCP